MPAHAQVVPALPGLILRDGQGGSAAGLGEFDAGLFDSAWGKLPGDAVAVDEAVALAQRLIDRPEPVIEVRTDTPMAKLKPLGQAVRWLALQNYRDPGDLEGARALARELAARLEELLGPLREGR